MKIYVVLRPENLLPVVAYTDREVATQHAMRTNGDVAPIQLNPEKPDLSDPEVTS